VWEAGRGARGATTPLLVVVPLGCKTKWSTAHPYVTPCHASLQVIVGDEVGNVHLLNLSLSTELTATEHADELEEMQRPLGASTGAGGSAGAGSGAGAGAGGAGEAVAAVETGASLEVDECRLYPRAPVTQARRVYLPHTYVAL
jgi:hypothetical protein